MPLTAPLADDSAIYEYSYTTGSAGVYALAGAWGGCFPFAAEFADGATITYRVTDESSHTEIGTATFSLGANTLTRTAIIASTNGGNPVNWTGRTRLLVHPLVKGLPLCATPPTNGQVLTWDAGLNEYCPATPSGGGSITVCATTPWDGADLVWQSSTSDWCPDARIYGQPNGGGVTLLAANDSAFGGDISITAGDLTGSGKTLASLTLAGTYHSTSQGGDINITSGDAAAGTNQRGGGLFYTAGNGAGSGGGGGIVMIAGDGAGNGRGGDIEFDAGNSSGTSGIDRAGDINLNAGVASSATSGIVGGSISIDAGAAHGGGSGGEVDIAAGDATAGNGNGGQLSLTSGTGVGTGFGGDIIIVPGGGNGSGHAGGINIQRGNGTDPPTPSAGFYIYVGSDHNLYAKGTSGTTTMLAAP